MKNKSHALESVRPKLKYSTKSWPSNRGLQQWSERAGALSILPQKTPIFMDEENKCTHWAPGSPTKDLMQVNFFLGIISIT